jgi:hypothetical protein
MVDALITRRKFTYLTAMATSAMLSCAQEHSDLLEQVEEMETEEDLAIIEGGTSMFRADGTRLGRLAPEGGSRFSPVVSPDAEFIAWYPPLAGYPPLSYQQQILTSDARGNGKTVTVDGVGGVMGISAGGQKIIAILAKAGNFRLVDIDTASGEERDLSGLVSRLNLRNVQRLRQSSDGNRLVISSEDSFYLADISSMNILSYRQGRYPCISPDGSKVAFVNNHALNIQNAGEDQSAKVISVGLKVDFAAGWSPNGRFLLVGGLKTFPMDYRLVAVDVVRERSAEVTTQIDEIIPDVWWIKRRFAPSQAKTP